MAGKIVSQLPAGNWTANYVNNEYDSKFARNGISFRVHLGPDRYDPLRGRETGLIRLHPARSMGTEGCIGIINNNPEDILRLKNKINNHISIHKTININVTYK